MPNLPFHGSTVGVAVNTKNALDQTANVGIDNWSVSVEGETEDGSRGVSADSRQRNELLKRVWQFPIKLVDNISGNPTQSFRSEIVTERSPEFLYLFQRSCG